MAVLATVAALTRLPSVRNTSLREGREREREREGNLEGERWKEVVGENVEAESIQNGWMDQYGWEYKKKVYY